MATENPNANTPTVVIPAKPVPAGQSYNDGTKVITPTSASPISSATGKNTTSIPTSEIQKNLGGLVVDNQYGPKTTDAVKNFQTQNGITSDGIFGPETQAKYDAQFGTTKTNSNLITTSGSSKSTSVKNSTDLNALLAKYNLDPNATNNQNTGTDANGNKTDANGNIIPTAPASMSDTTSGTSADPYIQQLDTMAAHSNTATAALISSIKSIKQNQAAKVDAQYNNYKSGLQLLGIQTNQATVTPDLLMSHINQAESEHQDKLTTLDNEEIKALTDAQTAQDNNDFKTLNEKMTYIKGLRTEKATELKNYQDTLTKYNETVTKQGDASAKLIAPDIYDAVQGLDAADQEQFLVSLSQKFNIPLNSIVKALVAQKPIADKEALAKEKADAANVLSPTEAKTLGVPYGTTKAEAAKMGITPKTTTKTSSANTIKEAKNEITTAFETGKDANGNVIGDARTSEGYVDPKVYIAAMKAWPGTEKEFLAQFPVKGNIRKESYQYLPENIRPVKTTTRTS